MTVGVVELQYVVRGTEDELALEKLVAAFERAGSDFDDLGKYLWPRLTPMLEAAVREQFDTEGGAGTRGSWAPLSAQYAAWKSAGYPGQPILRRTDHLYEGLTNSSSPFALRRSSTGDYSFGTVGVTYASYHQTGTRRMPDRPPFDFGPGVEVELTRIAAEAAREALQQARVDDFADLSGLHGES